MLRSSLAALTLALGSVLAWSAPAGADTRSVTIVDNAFSPETITVRIGDSVTWRNTGQRGHSVRADDGSFDSSPGCSFQNTSACLKPNQTYTVTFSNPGTYFYYCNVHGSPNGIGMAGSVTVASQGGGGGTTSTTAGTTSTTRRTTSTTAATTTSTTARTTTTAKGATTTTTRAPTTTTDAVTGTVVVPGDPIAATSTTVPRSPVVTLGAAQDDGDDGTTPLVIGLLVVLGAALITAAWWFRPGRGV